MGAEFEEALTTFKRAVRAGRARFPLSSAHYFETGKQHDPTRRRNLSTTMLRLAGRERLAPPHSVVPIEIRRALIDIFGLQLPYPHLDLWGFGAAHAFAKPALRFELPAEWQIALPPELYAVIQGRWETAVEMTLLGNVMSEGIPENARVRLHDLKNLTDDRFVQEQQSVATWIGELGRHRLEDIMLATAVADISDPLAMAATELGITADQIADNARAIIDAIPSRWVEMKLRHRRQSNPQTSWEGNDLNDVIALSVAVPYCDVVVTERSWASHISAAKIGDRYGTLVTPRLQDALDRLSMDS